MTYGKDIHATILSDHAKGATATEIQQHLTDLYNVKPCTNTIYAHINSITIKDVVDELMRQQERDITKAESPALRMKYRDLLLAKLMPQKIEQKIEGGETIRYEILDNSKNPDVQASSTAT